MTIDKIKHYLGKEIFNHISSLNEVQLKAMQKGILNDIDMFSQFYDDATRFKRNIELQYINIRVN